ncbi:MAG: GxxExxY protein [Candidatus Marinimicrobia bacterium]|nr:GxxExxY protein [Candidatus Neomarinimicrobiota bacterium]
MEVHKALGPGLLESAYEKCLNIELKLREIAFRTQVEIPLTYKGTKVKPGYRIDMLVEDRVVIELKAVESILPIHEAQLLTYLKLTKKRVGLILNFNSTVMKKGIKRMVL